MSQEFTNNASARLITDLQVADNSITLAPGDGELFPQPDEGDDDSFAMLTVEDVNANYEIMGMTARSGDILYVTRGMEGTSPAGFATGSRVECRLTAGSLQNFKQIYDQYDLRGDVIESDGLRLWHETDPATYQSFSFRYFTNLLFGRTVMIVQPPAGIPDLTVAAQITAPDGGLRGVTLGTDWSNVAPPGATGEVQFSVPGMIRFERISDYFAKSAMHMHYDVFTASNETENRFNQKSTQGATRFTWSTRDKQGVEHWAGFLEAGQMSCRYGVEIRNGQTETYPNAQGVDTRVGVDPYAPGSGDWMACITNAPVGAASVTRSLFYTWFTETMDRTGEVPVPIRKAVSIADGQVLVTRPPEAPTHLCNKDYVDGVVTTAFANNNLSTVSQAMQLRVNLWSSDGGTNDGSIKTFVGGKGLSDYRDVEITVMANGGGDFYSVRIDTDTIIEKGYGTVRWPVLNGVTKNGDNRAVYFNPKSDTTFAATEEESADGFIVKVKGIGPKLVGAQLSAGPLPANKPNPHTGLENLNIDRLVKTPDF